MLPERIGALRQDISDITDVDYIYQEDTYGANATINTAETSIIGQLSASDNYYIVYRNPPTTDEQKAILLNNLLTRNQEVSDVQYKASTLATILAEMTAAGITVEDIEAAIE